MSTLPKTEEFPLLAELQIPIQYNYAGVPMVPWFELRGALRDKDWERVFVVDVDKMTQVTPGMFLADEVENKLQEYNERIK